MDWIKLSSANPIDVELLSLFMRDNRSTSVPERKAAPLALGCLGVVCFSLTFPATTAAEASFSPVEVGVGRSVIGGLVAIAVLASRREPLLPCSRRSPWDMSAACTVPCSPG